MDRVHLVWWVLNQVFGLLNLASRFRIVKEECYQYVNVVVVFLVTSCWRHFLPKQITYSGKSSGSLTFSEQRRLINQSQQISVFICQSRCKTCEPIAAVTWFPCVVNSSIITCFIIVIIIHLRFGFSISFPPVACVAGVRSGGKGERRVREAREDRTSVSLPRSFWLPSLSTTCHAGYSNWKSWITNCCCFLHSVTYFHSQGVRPNEQ